MSEVILSKAIGCNLVSSKSDITNFIHIQLLSLSTHEVRKGLSCHRVRIFLEAIDQPFVREQPGRKYLTKYIQ